MIYYISNRDTTYDGIESSTVEDCIKYLSGLKSIAVDTETTGLDPHSNKILLLQVGDSYNQFVIDCTTVDIKQFKQLLETKKLILHNAKFDYKFLKMAGITIEHIWDTMLAKMVLFCGYDDVSYTLESEAEEVLKIKLDKDVRKSFIGLDIEELAKEHILYAAEDIAILHNIAIDQVHRLRKYNLMNAAEMEFQVLKAFGDIELNGMYLDTVAWLENYAKNESLMKVAEIELDNLLLKESKLEYIERLNEEQVAEQNRLLNINYRSPKQVKEMFHKLGFRIESTRSDMLEKYTHKHPIFKALIKLREISKAVSTYGEKFLLNINENTGRVHSDFYQVLNTYRVSSNNPNLQNIPRSNDFRNCFKPRPGYVWVSIDYSQQELRLMADFSEEEGFINVMNAGEDAHCFAGSMMFKRTITEEDKELRDRAKAINFGKP